MCCRMNKLPWMRGILDECQLSRCVSPSNLKGARFLAFLQLLIKNKKQLHPGNRAFLLFKGEKLSPNFGGMVVQRAGCCQ